MPRNMLARDDERRLWVPGFAATLRLLLLVRVASALFSGISDCDETYNYWEPLHLLSHPPGSGSGRSWQSPFQTWEYAPEYAIRSWAYLVQYLPAAGLVPTLLDKDKSASFYTTRTFLAFCSAVCEASLVQSTAQAVNGEVARYLLLLLMTAAGMYESATALLPSTFVMYTTTLAYSFALFPSHVGASRFPINGDLARSNVPQRTLLATAAFALGALLAWPFALVLALPFVFEELFIPSGLLVRGQQIFELILQRATNWLRCVFISALMAAPIVLIDTLAYGRFALVPLNIIVYNILSARRGAGPTLYGVEPWYYYMLNLTLNFGPTLYLALSSLPLVFIRERLHKPSRPKDNLKDHKALCSSSSTMLLLVRLAPVYLWLALLSSQPHKEERFFFAAYPLLCFNASVALYCLRDIVQGLLATPRRAHLSKKVASLVPTVLLFGTAAFSALRVAQNRISYRAPFAVLEHLAEHEIPRLRQEEQLLATRLVRLCYGKEWHRFPSSYLVPEGVNVDFIRSEFRGILPKHFAVQRGKDANIVDDGIVPSSSLPLLDSYLSALWPWRATTRALRSGFNDLNREELDRYVSVEQCDYLVDVDFPHAHSTKGATAAESTFEPRFVRDEARWTQVLCVPFLDAPASRAAPHTGTLATLRATVERVFWLPALLRAGTNRYGDYCLLRAKYGRS